MTDHVLSTPSAVLGAAANHNKLGILSKSLGGSSKTNSTASASASASSARRGSSSSGFDSSACLTSTDLGTDAGVTSLVQKPKKKKLNVMNGNGFNVDASKRTSSGSGSGGGYPTIDLERQGSGDELFGDDVSTLSTLTNTRTSHSSRQTTSDQTDKTMRSSTRVIKPHAGSHRDSFDKAQSSLAMSQLRFDSRSLYGRSKEIGVLTNAFGNAKMDGTGGGTASPTKVPTTTPTTATATGDGGLQEQTLSDVPEGEVRHEDDNSNALRQLVLIEGPAGVGKSALALHLQEQVVREAGFFLAGKFDQSPFQQQQQQDSANPAQQYEPYSAFTMICRELCESLLAHKRDPDRAGCKWQFTFDQFQTKLLNELRHAGDSSSSTSEEEEEKQAEEKTDTEQPAGGRGTPSGGRDDEVIQVLTTVFPDLVQLFGLEGGYLTQSSDMGYLEAKNRFNYAFRRLMRVLTSFGRVVLVLDDLQWSDAASLDLLKTLLTDCNHQHQQQQSGSGSGGGTSGADREDGLLVVATVRSNEIDEYHPLTATLREVESILSEQQKHQQQARSLKIHRLQVGNLQLQEVNDMLVDLLSVDHPSETQALSECVHRKTQGNIFFVKQFLKSLTSVNPGPPLLVFQMGRLRWTWNVEEIEVRESSTKNVVDIIQDKMNTLPLEIQKLLPVVACLGASIDFSLFERVLEHFNKVVVEDNHSISSGSRSHTIKSKGSSDSDDNPNNPNNENDVDNHIFEPYCSFDFVKLCVHEGLLTHDKTQNLLKWEHDKIQEAALTLAEPYELANLRYKLGEFLMEDCDQKEVENNIFILVSLLDEDTTKVPKNNPKRIMLADLNLTAGNKAIKGAAFLSAANYLSRGIQVLPEGHWESHYQLSLKLFSSAAEAHHCIGNLEESKQFCDAVISQPDRPVMDKKRAYTVLLDTISNAEGDTILAQKKCLEILALLGCTFPKMGVGFHTIGGLLKIEMNVKKLIKEIPSLPVMTDPTKAWAMLLLDRCATYVFQNNSDLLPLIVFKQLQYTRKFGYTHYSPPALCFVGLLLAAALNDLEGARKFGDIALNLYENDAAKTGGGTFTQVAKSRTLFVASISNLHWQLPTTHLRKTLLDGYKVGLGSGDVESAMWSIYSYLDIGFHNGLPLAMLERDCEVYAQQMQELGQDKHYLYLVGLWQVVSNLLGREEDMSELNGSIVNLEEFLPLCDKQQGARTQIERFQVLTAFWSGNFVKTAKLSEQFEVHKAQFQTAFAGTYVLPQLLFNCALACYGAFKETKKRKYKSLADTHSKKIFEWAKRGDPNVVHAASLLQAESLSLKKNKFAESVKLYKDAINLAGRQGFIHDRAIASERLGEFYVSLDLKSDAKYYFQEAIKYYVEWGSVRGDVVYARHGHLLDERPTSLMFPTTEASSSNGKDSLPPLHLGR